MRIPSGTLDQVIFFVAVDSTDLKTRETGLTTFTVYRARDTGAATLMTTPTVAELSAANMPGVYSLLLDEDMTIAAGNDSEEMVFHITHAGMAPVTRTIELYRPKITLGETVTAANGAADADVERLQGSLIATPTVAGVLEVDLTHIVGATVNTTLAQLGVNVVNAAGTAWGSGAITAGVIAADAIGASELAADAVAEIADAVWDEDATGHQTLGTFGQAIGDPVADTNSIFKAVVTDAAGATVGVDVVAVQADTDNIQTRLPAALVSGRMDSDVGAMQAGTVTAAVIATGAIDADAIASDAITAAKIAADAIGASELAADAVTEIRSVVSGTSDSGTTTTMVDAARTEADTDYWKGDYILFTSGTIAGQCRLITGFTPASDTITFAPAVTQTVGTETYEILPSGRADVELWDGSAVNALISGKIDANAQVVGTGAIVAGSFAAGAIDATAIAADAIGASELATDAVAEIADAIWDEDATGHQTLGTFGQAIGDPVADANTIFKAVVTDATGATVGVDIVAVQADTDDIQTKIGTPSNLGGGATLAFNLSDIEAQTDDIGVAGAGLTAVPWNAAWDAEVESEVNDALVVHRLDELLNADSDIDGVAPPTVGSVFHELLTKAAAAFTYDQSTDSLEAVRDNMGTAQTGDSFARLGAPAGASVSGDIAAVKVDTAAILVDTGTTLDGRIPAALVGGKMDSSVSAMTAPALKDFFDTDSTTTYAAAVAGSVVAEIADNAAGASLTEAGIADAVWDELIAGHLGAGSTGLTLNNSGGGDSDPFVDVIP